MPEPPSGATTEADPALAGALATIALLATEVGPRRPTSSSERHAAGLVAQRLRERGLDPRTEPFAGYSTFAAPFGLIAGLAVLSGAFGILICYDSTFPELGTSLASRGARVILCTDE